MPIPFLALASALPGIFKGVTGALQMGKKVEHVDTTPPAFKEQLQELRLHQNGLAPGYAQQANQLAQGQAVAAQNALRGAGSSADVLASVGAADARRQVGIERLGVQQGQYHDRATAALNQGLQQQAQYQQQQRQQEDQAQAALSGNGLSNLFGGVSDATSALVYAGEKSKEDDAKKRGGPLMFAPTSAIR